MNLVDKLLDKIYEMSNYRKEIRRKIVDRSDDIIEHLASIYLFPTNKRDLPGWRKSVGDLITLIQGWKVKKAKKKYFTSSEYFFMLHDAVLADDDGSVEDSQLIRVMSRVDYDHRNVDRLTLEGLRKFLSITLRKLSELLSQGKILSKHDVYDVIDTIMKEM